jgi:two-component system phosphate regulon response regulator PhoB
MVAIMANAGDVNGALLMLAQKLQEFLGAPEKLVASERSVINVAELHVDSDAHRVTVHGEDVFLTTLELKLLVTLLRRRDRVQGRSALLSEVWVVSGFNKTRTVDTHVKRLRDKLGSAGRFIQTVRGVGYRFSEGASARDARRRRASGPARVSLRLAPRPAAAAV